MNGFQLLFGVYDLLSVFNILASLLLCSNTFFLHWIGRFLGELTKQVFSDLAASKYQVLSWVFVCKHTHIRPFLSCQWCKTVWQCFLAGYRDEKYFSTAGVLFWLKYHILFDCRNSILYHNNHFHTLNINKTDPNNVHLPLPNDAIMFISMRTYVGQCVWTCWQ